MMELLVDPPETEEEERFFLFAGHRCYPEGGSQDFRGDFQRVEDAKDWFRQNKHTIRNYSYDLWADIVDAKTMKSVAYGTVKSVDGEDWCLENWYLGVEDYEKHDV